MKPSRSRPRAIREAAFLAFAIAAPLTAAVQVANQAERIVRFEYRVVNRADRAQDIVLQLALPQDNERQEVREVIPEPGFERLFHDRFGNRLVTYRERDVQPGEMRQRGWMARVRTRSAVWLPLPRPARLPAAERQLYTRDLANYQITSPLVLALRDRLVRPGMDDEATARAIYDHLVAHVTYYRDDAWDAAPTVLQKGQGSCSEFNYAFIALLRASGIPARYSGGPVLSADTRTTYDPRVHEDAVFHRWTEIFLRRYGWMPVDTSRGATAWRRYDNVLNLWGRLPAGSLQTCRGDGGEDEPLGWDYVGTHRPQLPDSVRDAPVAYWIDDPGGDLQAVVDRTAAALDAPPTAASLAPLLADTLGRETVFFLARRLGRLADPLLAAKLLRLRHPAALYYALRAGATPAPATGGWEALADDYLRGEIARTLGSGDRDWPAFEYWWRKARAKIAWRDDAGVFVLTDRSLNVY